MNATSNSQSSESRQAQPPLDTHDRVFSWVKVVTTNVLLLLAGFALVIGMPVAIYEIWNLVRTPSAITSVDQRGSLPNYDHVDWADAHFAEYRALQTSYFDHFVWRRQAFTGETINIDEDGIRATYQLNAGTEGETLWAMGGSTMWGIGARDSETIPSFLASMSGYNSKNLGESAYRSRQSLNFLLYQLSTHESPDVYVSYDGYNDVRQGCWREVRSDGTNREMQIREAIEREEREVLTFRYLLEPTVEFLRRALSRSPAVSGPDELICDTNAERAQQVARALITDWQTMQGLADRQGGYFLPVLQPTLALSDSQHSELEVSAVEEEQLKAVYPLIREEAKRQGLEILDLSASLDGTRDVFIDQIHLSPEGNAIVANEINRRLNAR